METESAKLRFMYNMCISVNGTAVKVLAIRIPSGYGNNYETLSRYQGTVITVIKCHA